MLSKAIKSTLWFSAHGKIETANNPEIVIGQILNFGPREATDWLFRHYKKQQIAKFASNLPQSAWDKKSLNFWKIILGINPPRKRKIG